MMTTARPAVRLEVLTVPHPCPADFAAMAAVDGDRVRHCRHCDHAVFDLSAMPRAAAEQLVADHWAAGASMCVRLTKRADGTVTTADDCRRRWRSAALGWARRWGGPVGAALSVLLAMVGCGGPPDAEQVPIAATGGILACPPSVEPATRPTSAPATGPAPRASRLMGSVAPPSTAR